MYVCTLIRQGDLITIKGYGYSVIELKIPKCINYILFT